ncbi:MAG: NUDIX domain-containing protein [Patescibacteria group bacterium]|jgi:hypothetical protein
MQFEMQWGMPIVRSYQLDEYLLHSGIRPWKHLAPPVDFDRYRQGQLSEEQIHELEFSPKTEVLTLEKPNGATFRGFRTVAENCSTVFCILPGDVLPIIVEWRHGAEVISLVPPTGVVSAVDHGDMAACAKREFEEETGIILANLHPLSTDGIPLSTRGNTQRYFPFLGYAEEPIVIEHIKLDENEYLKVMLIPLADWLKLISAGRVPEEISIGITFLALQRIGRLKLA